MALFNNGVLQARVITLPSTKLTIVLRCRAAALLALLVRFRGVVCVACPARGSGCAKRILTVVPAIACSSCI